MNLYDNSLRENYVNACQSMVCNVDALSEKALHDGLVNAVNNCLELCKVPKVTSATNSVSKANAEFDYQTWCITFGDPLMGAASLPKLLLGVNTVYHEARHCEQWFRMAQAVADGQLNKRLEDRIDPNKATDIADKMWIPQNVAQTAINSRAEHTSVDAKLIKDWWESIYANQSGIRSRKLGNIHHRYDAYRNLPEEIDAWYLGDDVEDKFNSKCDRVGCPSYAYWKTKTAVSCKPRSSGLKAVDTALEAFHKSEADSDRATLKKAFDSWYGPKKQAGTIRGKGKDNVVDQLEGYLNKFNDQGKFNAQGAQMINPQLPGLQMAFKKKNLNP